MNNKLTKQEEDVVIESLTVWYWDNQDKIKLDKAFWDTDRIGKELRRIMKKAGKYKHNPRGNPKKGYQKMQESLSRPEEFDLDF